MMTSASDIHTEFRLPVDKSTMARGGVEWKDVAMLSDANLSESGFPTFTVATDAAQITLAMVNANRN